MSFNQIDDVAGVVVLYEPTEEIFQNIQSYITQVKRLFVVDNSENSDKLLIENIKRINNAEYIGLKENIGIAAALNIGAKRAIEEGYRYLLTIDQDSEATPNVVEKLIEIYHNYKSVGIAAPYPLNRIHKILPRDNLIHQTNKVITSGALLNLRAYIEVGPFMEELFIDYVDFEFCFRLRKNGFNIYIDHAAILYHNVGELKKRRFLGKYYYSTNHSPLRLYYRTRNRFYIRSLYNKEFSKFFKHDWWSFNRDILKIFIAESDKIEKMKMIIKGYRDYRSKIFGKFKSDS
jgi:rhamnosyltransferase